MLSYGYGAIACRVGGCGGFEDGRGEEVVVLFEGGRRGGGFGVVVFVAGCDNDLWNDPWGCVHDVHVVRVQNGCGHAVIRVETLGYSLLFFLVESLLILSGQ